VRNTKNERTREGFPGEKKHGLDYHRALKTKFTSIGKLELG